MEEPVTIRKLRLIFHMSGPDQTRHVPFFGNLQMAEPMHNRFLGQTMLCWLTLPALLLVAITGSACLGYVPVSMQDVASVLWQGIAGYEASVPELVRVMVLEVRLPRILTAAAAGAALAVSGGVYQTVLRNPLADPYTLGVSSGAAFGAAVALLFRLGGILFPVSAAAFTGAILTLGVVLLLSRTGGGRIGTTDLILSGIMVSAILAAGLSFLKYLADEEVGVIIFWLMGSFASTTWKDAFLVGGCALAGLLFFMGVVRDLNLLSLGEKSARSLGVNTTAIMISVLIVASFLAAVTVSVSGIIGFVGLLVPHMVRFVTGPDCRKLLPACFFWGAILLLCADTVTRALLPSEVPIGVLTALIGGPVFCFIFRKTRNGSPT